MTELSLPPLRDVATDLREGTLFSNVCAKYGVDEDVLTERLAYAGYDVTGEPLAHEPRTGPLTDVLAEGMCITGNGGGDYVGLPIHPVPHTRLRREFLGLDWTTSPASGPMWKYV